MINTVKNKIYLKESQYISLDLLFYIIARNYSITLTNSRRGTIVRHEKQADIQNNYSCSNRYEIFYKK